MSFSDRMGGPKLTPPTFLLGLCWVFVFLFAILGPRAHGVPPPRWASILDGFWFHFGAKLALCWTIWAKELALDGLVGLREALRILFFSISILGQAAALGDLQWVCRTDFL